MRSSGAVIAAVGLAVLGAQTVAAQSKSPDIKDEKAGMAENRIDQSVGAGQRTLAVDRCGVLVRPAGR